MKISILGLGYVGCVSMAGYAELGHNLIGADINEHKVDLINRGMPTIIEKDIDRYIRKGFENGQIEATTDTERAVLATDVTFLCVGTPSGSHGEADLSHLHRCVREVGYALARKESFHTVAIRSTVPPGTAHAMIKTIEEASGKRSTLDFGVVSHPEFMREGCAIEDFFHPPFILLGSDSQKSMDILRKLCEPIAAETLIRDIEVVEFIKYVNNAFHALKISFANEIGLVAKGQGIDGQSVMELFCRDRKLNLSESYLRPGFAYGGSCLPKDLAALQVIARNCNISTPILSSISESNEALKRLLVKRIIAYDLTRVGVLGLSFKAGTDDVRNSPIVEILEILIGKGYEIRIYDSYLHLSNITGTNKEYLLRKLPVISRLITDNMRDVIENSELVVIHSADSIPEDKGLFDGKVVIDLQRKLHPEEFNGRYDGIAW